MIDIRSGCCPLCDHREILEATPPDFGDGIEYVAAVTYAPRAIFPGRNAREPIGELRLYVCRSCGYCQTFAENPGEIPVDPDYCTRLIKGSTTSGHYR